MGAGQGGLLGPAQNLPLPQQRGKGEVAQLCVRVSPSPPCGLLPWVRPGHLAPLEQTLCAPCPQLSTSAQDQPLHCGPGLGDLLLPPPPNTQASAGATKPPLCPLPSVVHGVWCPQELQDRSGPTSCLPPSPLWTCH